MHNNITSYNCVPAWVSTILSVIIIIRFMKFECKKVSPQLNHFRLHLNAWSRAVSTSALDRTGFIEIYSLLTSVHHNTHTTNTYLLPTDYKGWIVKVYVSSRSISYLKNSCDDRPLFLYHITRMRLYYVRDSHVIYACTTSSVFRIVGEKKRKKKQR